jgi:hypothetical protein
MTKQETLDAVYGALVEIRAKHPHGLRAIGDANCHHVLTRFGVPGQVAELCSITLEVLQEHGGMRNPMELVELIADQIKPDGTLVEPFKYNCDGVKPGEKDDRGLFTHPDKLFTACNWNGKRYGIEGDASQSPTGGLEYYQDWRDAGEIIASGVRIKSAWDAQAGRFLTPAEIDQLFHSAN